MAATRAGRTVVQPERLSDQVYELIRQDLWSGAFGPGQRLVELELAARYNVSRTPVREALVQLSRDGLLMSNERGYLTPHYSRVDIMNRLELMQLLWPRLAEHAAVDCEPQQTKAFARALEREKVTHAAGKIEAFNSAYQDGRRIYRSMCKNEMLVRCASLVDDQFEFARSRIHKNAQNREITIRYNERLLETLTTRDPKAAAAVTIDMVNFLQVYYTQHPPADFG